MFTTFISKNKFHEDLKTTVDELEKRIESTDKALIGSSLSVLGKDSYHFVSWLPQPETKVGKMLFAMLLNIAYKVEMVGAGGGFLSFLFAIQFIKRWLKSERPITEQEFEDECKELARNLQQHSTIPTEQTVMDQISRVCEQDADLMTVIQQAALLAGSEGNIIMKNGSQKTGYIVELKQGCQFNLVPCFHCLSWERHRAKMLLVDGVIEKVSEIEHLLMKSMETKLPVLIVTQGYSEEVLATVKLNNDRGVFDIMLLKALPDLEGLNVLNDIACVVGTDVVSSLKGELLVFKTYDSIPTVENVVSLQQKTLTIGVGDRTRGAVANQIKSLFEKRSQQSVDSVLKLADNRIQSLLAQTVEIQLPNLSPGRLETIRTKLDISLRTVRTVLSHGTTKDGVPVLTAYASVWLTGKTLIPVLKSEGCVVVGESDF